MSGNAATTPTAVWIELRGKEWEAALIGGNVWGRFVIECERRLGLQWESIREEFNRMDEREHGYAR